MKCVADFRPLSFRAKGEILPLLPEILPFWIHANDQSILLLTPPSLDFFLSRESALHVVGLLEVDKLAHVVLFRESLEEFVLVFVKAPRKVVGDTDVQDSLVPVGQKVNVVAIFGGHCPEWEQEGFLPLVEMTERAAPRGII